MVASILITGHTGFVGTNLVRALQDDFVLYGLDIAADNALAGDVSAAAGAGHSTEEPAASGNGAGAKMPLLPSGNTFSWDQLDSLPDADAIIHLAGMAHDTANVSAPEEYFEVNLGLTKRIFDHFLQSKATTFIFFSSVKAIADTVEGETLTEEHAPGPKTPYGQSKLAAERYILEQTMERKNDGTTERWNDGMMERMSGGTREQGNDGTKDRGNEGTGERGNDEAKERGNEGARARGNEGRRERGGVEGKKVYILRPVMIHGPGNKGNLNLLYKVVQKGIPWPLGAFHNQRSFLSINNLEYVIRQLIEKDITPGIYQVADDEPVSTNELIRLMAQSMNRKARIWNLPPGIIRGMARTGDLLHLPLNSERLKKLTESYIVSNTKIKNALGIEKMPTSATDGIIQTLKSFAD